MSLIQYFKDVRGEMRHVSWPTKRQGIIYTALVIAISLVVALYLGALDFIFSRALEFLI